jgi:anti-sigma factor RsiW
MKESRYIELLNLYVDHRLTPEEAAELETEVQRNPARRKVYLQYCRIQKACAR